jgi:SNF2 family DNA or RNA helicase
MAQCAVGVAPCPSLFAVEDATARDWLGALLRKDAQIQASVAQAQRLHASYRAWLRNLHVAGDSNFRVTLRLDAPEQADANQEPVEWSLRYLLQARDDPSLMVDASEIWQKRSELLSGLQQRLHNPQELLLGGLGFVARHSDPVRRSLQDKRPVVARLSSDEAFTYMRQVAPLLESSGFGVLVPPWWNQPGGRLGLRLRMKGKGSSSGNSDGVGSGLLNMNTLASYRWELSVGGEALSREEFETLVALKSSLVKVRGKWVQLDAEQIEAAIRFWQRQDDETEIGLLDAAALTLDGAQLNGLPVEGVEAEGWLQEWLDRFTGHETLAVLPPPDGLTATLRPYQAYGYSWLDFQRRWGIGVCLADDMGLGKTIQTLSMLQRVKEQAGALPAPVLLVAPTSVVVNWVKEAARFTPELRVLVHQGGQRLRGDEFAEVARQHDFVATSYALVRRDAEVMQTIDWFGVILDEAQNIKNPETKQTQLIRQLPASFRLALTGTPVENRLTELWSIMHFLNPGFLGSRRTFRERFAQPIERDNDEQASARLRRLISPFILRRVKSDPSVIQDLSLKAGGVGLNLTAATHVFHFDRWWNPAVENQATDRAFRIGQTRTVQVHKFVVRGTLEERIDEMIESKTELAENIIGAGERWLTELDTDQLRDPRLRQPMQTRGGDTLHPWRTIRRRPILALSVARTQPGADHCSVAGATYRGGWHGRGCCACRGADGLHGR